MKIISIIILTFLISCKGGTKHTRPQSDDVDPIQPIYFDVDTTMLNVHLPDSLIKKNKNYTGYILVGISVSPDGEIKGSDLLEFKSFGQEGLEFHRGNEVPQAILPYKYFFEKYALSLKVKPGLPVEYKPENDEVNVVRIDFFGNR